MKPEYFLGILLILLAGSLRAEEVTVIVTSIPANTPEGAQIFIAGTFNNWDPGHASFILEPNDEGEPEIVLTGEGTISFKFTRGSWQTVEGNENGGFLPNRSFTFGTADTLQVNILSWEDTGETNSTAAENVIILSTDFEMPQLNRTRRIWIYFPPDYENSGEQYPVLYMHDGQNLFDQATSFAGEWEVDETLNDLFEEGQPVPIVVGIDNGGGDRIDEYTPWLNNQYGGGDGDLYANFIIETLKPFIDENYRTFPGREHTGVMGSSLGGLISFYIAHKHQDVFSKAGIFSPSFWFSDSVYTFASETGKQHPMKYFIMGGSNESSGLVDQMQAMVDTLFSIGFGESEVTLVVVPGGQHNEILWQSQFGQAYQWLFNTSATYTPVIYPEREIKLRQQGNRIWLEQGQGRPEGPYHLQIFNLFGQALYGVNIMAGQAIHLPPHLRGLVIARVIGNDLQFTQKIWLP
ncbi:MAG: alpha/beta hydrolase-fold protein [Bacteroides sp.]|jgi:predicted alpha/beta superfamily hydrolase|nr:alpha/beta hydrolase-fold protein [Bacteroides sp.]